MQNKYVLKTSITGNDVSFDSKLSIAGVMTLFQLACGMHTYAVKVDYENVLKNFNGKWVITDVHFEIDRLAAYGESVTVETWPLKAGPVRFPRIFVMKDANGNDIVRAYTNWCLLDAGTDALMRSSVLGDPFGEYLQDKPISAAPKDRAVELTADDLHHTHTARLADLDMNGHVNNVSYIRMALDCFNMDEYSSTRIKACNVYYKSQAYEGETLDIYRKDDGECIFIEARAAERVVFRLNLEVE